MWYVVAIFCVLVRVVVRVVWVGTLYVMLPATDAVQTMLHRTCTSWNMKHGIIPNTDTDTDTDTGTQHDLAYTRMHTAYTHTYTYTYTYKKHIPPRACPYH